MKHLIDHIIPLELFAWLDEEAEIPGWDVLTDNPFASAQPDDQFSAPQNYFAEYHLEYCRQRQFNEFPSRIHSLLLFATRADAHAFAQRHPTRVQGKSLSCAQSSGAYKVSFHDASFLDYLRLPHSLSLEELTTVAQYYWSGTLAETSGLRFMGEIWRNPPIIEAVFQGNLAVSFAKIAPRRF